MYTVSVDLLVGGQSFVLCVSSFKVTLLQSGSSVSSHVACSWCSRVVDSLTASTVPNRHSVTAPTCIHDFPPPSKLHTQHLTARFATEGFPL